jgi:hypothetical protein
VRDASAAPELDQVVQRPSHGVSGLVGEPGEVLRLGGAEVMQVHLVPATGPGEDRPDGTGARWRNVELEASHGADLGLIQARLVVLQQQRADVLPALVDVTFAYAPGA